VVNDEEHFRTEAEALKVVSRAYNAMPPETVNDLHYAIGSCSYSDEDQANELGRELQALAVSAKAKPRQGLRSGGVVHIARKTPLEENLEIVKLTTDFRTSVDSRDTSFIHFQERSWVTFPHDCWFRDPMELRKSLLCQPLVGGTIVMRVGIPLKETEINPASWVRGVCKCLRAGWIAGWSQGDGRLRNTMKFDQYQLIDYNHAVQLTELDHQNKSMMHGTRSFCSGSLYEGLGPRLANCEKNQEMNWSAADDYEMILLALQELLVP